MCSLSTSVSGTISSGPVERTRLIAGFRFRAGNLGALYNVQPDLSTYGKVMGGGMPVAAVAGRSDIMNLVSRQAGSKVRFSGGTYSAHPASLLGEYVAPLHTLADLEEAAWTRLREVV